MATEPIVPTAAGLTLYPAGVALPPLTILGVQLGLRPELLIAGFFGALVAMLLLNSVPSDGEDTWRSMVRTALRRMGVALASSLMAGYVAPLAPLVAGGVWSKVVGGVVPEFLDSMAVAVLAAFIVGVFAQRILQLSARRLSAVGKKGGAS